ncbi:hypothetical protein F9L16_11820 [Agarivorans sp. B2Z047]|uniref:hypothetical protein n=1 Tax=Agarivorans sp. B2Z047 TaxID=2652721 RepID=UPI00128CA4D2|nr:hypothetical protein [Agarivorans sp. B2Z047]MPW29675.1 hypothetical protein [Agarivorans sp. B2Z047]UQN40629.1 hypothetical protein LQZ07_12605 [Agarivorans sp. B2Z047]
MRIRQRINSDIYKSISPTNIAQFTVVEVRDSILERSDMYGNKNTARLFVARQLQILEDAGFIKSDRIGHKKYYSRTPAFFEANFKLIEKKKRTNVSYASKNKQQKPVVIDLENEKTDIEAKLAITLAEVDEYKILMARSGELKQLLSPSYSAATQKAAALMAKLNVWSSAIDLIKHSRSTAC